MDNQLMVKRFVSQKFIGYSPSRNRSYYESQIEMSDGSIVTRWCYTWIDDKQHTYISDLLDRYPVVNDLVK